MTTDTRLIVLSVQDNICVLSETISAGETIMIKGKSIIMPATLGLGHKLSTRPISAGTDVLKYGFPIGYAAVDIPLGTHVHVHNLSSRHTPVEIME